MKHVDETGRAAPAQSAIAKKMRTDNVLYRAGGSSGRYGDATFYSTSPQGAAVYGNPETYQVNVPKNTFDAAGNHFRLYQQFLDETRHPAGRGANALPLWTAEPELRQWLKEKGHRFKAINFDENTRIPSIAIYGKHRSKRIA